MMRRDNEAELFIWTTPDGGVFGYDPVEKMWWEKTPEARFQRVLPEFVPLSLIENALIFFGKGAKV